VDLQRADEDLVLLALSTLRRAGLAGRRYDRGELEALEEQLERLSRGECQDIVLFAQGLAEELSRNPLLQAQDSLSISAEIEFRAGGEGACLLLLEDFLELTTRKQLGYLRGWGESLPEGFREFCLKLLALPELDRNTQAAVIGQLGRIGDKQDLGVLRPFLSSADGRVRANAIEALERLATPPEVFAVLLPHLKDPDSRARANALKALSCLDPQMVLGALANMVGSSSVAAKASALYVLSHLRSPEALDLLDRLARDVSEEVRRRVAEALDGKQGDRVEGLLERLVNDLDVDVAERALEIMQRLYEETGRNILDRTLPREGDGSPSFPPPSKPASEVTQEIAPEPPPERFPEISPEATAEASPPPATAGPTRPSQRPQFLDGPGEEEETDEEVAYTQKVPKLDLSPLDGRDDWAESEDLEEADPLEDLDFRSISQDLDLGFAEKSEDLDLEFESREGLPLSPREFQDLPLETQQALEPVYQDLDQALIEMGEKAAELLDSGRLWRSEWKQALSRVKQMRELLATQTAGKQSGLLSRFFSSGKNPDVALQRSHLDEACRSLGEQVLEIYYREELRYGELEPHYRRVEGLLERARTAQK
jgi:hypothetical protein